MEQQPAMFDCAIIGGGLAGLCLAIQLADADISVVLLEKNSYPFHKVCGEYISMESWDFLAGLGVPLAEMNLPVIDQLGISSEKGFMLNHTLKLGGFGISRYSLDSCLSDIAKAKGVKLVENCKVSGVNRRDSEVYEVISPAGTFMARAVCGSYGKYVPSFLSQDTNKRADNYIGVKYHIKADLISNRIELHNFKDGYCGISKVDNDWHCLCYLTTAKNLLENSKDINTLEQNILYKNPYLKSYFTQSEFVSAQPMVISNIQFSEKSTNTDGMFLLGDAAGSITPLCGNGMSMGMRGSKILAAELIRFFQSKQSFEQVVRNYRTGWSKAFHTRITAGYYLQNLFGKRNTTDLALKVLSKVPAITGKLISLTHGKRF